MPDLRSHGNVMHVDEGGSDRIPLKTYLREFQRLTIDPVTTVTAYDMAQLIERELNIGNRA